MGPLVHSCPLPCQHSSGWSSSTTSSPCSPSAAAKCSGRGRAQWQGLEAEAGFCQTDTESQEDLEEDTPRDPLPPVMATMTENKQLNHLCKKKKKKKKKPNPPPKKKKKKKKKS